MRDPTLDEHDGQDVRQVLSEALARIEALEKALARLEDRPDRRSQPGENEGPADRAGTRLF